MSKVAIQGAATGTGVFTLASPATNTDRTLTLPDEAGTVLTDRVIGVNASAPDDSLVVDASGSLLVGTTSTAIVNAANFSVFKGTNVATLTTNFTGSAFAGDKYARFGFNGTEAGSISIVAGGTTVAYNTSSDYRLKENIQPMTNALAKVAALKPRAYIWKSTGEADEGFIAHELAEVCPSAVTGEKDAVDADGNPQYQGIDTSFLVATLTAAIQELKAINDAQAQTIESLTARVSALEAS